jgi:hypothetical protein
MPEVVADAVLDINRIDSFHSGMLFGRQQNLARRAVRPDGRVVRDLRRRSLGKASLLDLHDQTKRPPLMLRLVRGVIHLLGRR